MNESLKLAQSSAIISGLRELFFLLRGRRTKVFLYGSALAFVAFTAYLAFCPAEKGSPWFNDFFSYASASTASYRSQISSIVSYIFPNSSSPQIPASFPEGGGASEGSLTSAARGEMDQDSGALTRKMDTAAGGGGGARDRRSGILAKNETMSNGAAVAEGDGGRGGARDQKSGVLGKTDATEAKGDDIANADGVRSQRGRVSEGNSTTAGRVAGDQKSGVSAKKSETATATAAAADGVARSQRGGTSASNLTNSGGGAKDQKSRIFLAKKNETAAAAADGVAAEKGGISPPNDHTSNRIESQGNGVAKNTTTKGVSKTKDLGASTKTSVLTTRNQTVGDSQSKNQITSGVLPLKASDLQAKNTTKATGRSNKDASAAQKNQTAKGEASGETKVSTSSKESAIAPQNNGSLAKNQSISFGSSVTNPDKKGKGRNQADWISSMKSCDIFQGKWVKDNSYPLYPEGSCPHIDEPFDCYRNGRPDQAYQKLRWQPISCNIPRLNATDMLERLRGKRLVFVGDSLNRNMWESLVCVLRNSIKDKSKVFEASGQHEFRTEGSYSFVFKDFNCSVEFFRSPFLVQEWETPASNGTKETLRLDIIERSSSRYKDADVIVFNTGHWWTHEKTSKGKDYYQEGNHIYSELNVVEAFHKALNTWAKWVDVNVNPKKSLVFFRGYSSSHFSGGQWNSGGQCDIETEPIKNEKFLSSYPSKMAVLESVIKGMKTRVAYLNITRMTDYRKDAHPSIYRKQNLTDEERRDPGRFQDCSHWCLPGVPDSWNELLYAQLILKQHQVL